MFKHLTHTLKLGLTTLTILTAGAGAAFAQPAGFATAIDPIDDCLNSGSRGPSYCTIQVVNCINNPFGSSCATTLGTKAHTVAKVRYCRDQDVPSVASKATTHPCSDTWGGVNAAMWAKQNPDAPDSPDIDRPRHQFLKGGAAGLDTSGIAIKSGRRHELYFDIATFDGRALGGDATDGVAFVTSWPSPVHYYVGILSGTDLGAPVDNPAGTTASWVGQFQATYLTVNRDFVLEVTFGGNGNKAGSIEAFVDRKGGNLYSSHNYKYFYLKGDFDDSGLITNGTVDAGNYTNKDRDNPTGTRHRGVLTGLIGQEGAVGAFYSNYDYYSGGFVARPPSELDTAFLNTTCSADPFTNRHQDLCYLEYADDRVTRINDCITGGNASDASQCGTAIAEHECINNPFASDCVDDFTDYYETARTNRIQFCLDNTIIDNIKTSNLTNGLCTNSDTVAGICDYAPFASVCFDNNDYDTVRATKYPTCHADPSVPSCTGVTDRPNAIAWADSLAKQTVPVILTDAPSTTNRSNQFLKDLEDKSAGNLDVGDRVGDIVVSSSGSLNLSTATFNGTTPLDGDAADGVAYFRGSVNGEGRVYYYSGIFSGTDLGAPLGPRATDGKTTASWVGKFQTVGHNVNRDFVLEVDYANKTVDAFVVWPAVSSYHFYLEGNYDDKGIITGDFNLSNFRNKNRKTKNFTYITGVVTGLIGQDGAVGAFHSSNYGYTGGFVARPANAADNSYLDTTCTEDPFGYLCYLETDKQAAKIIECTEGSNASTTDCARAVQLNECLTNPFHSDCEDDFADYYVAAREKRAEFCVGDLTNSLCTGTGATAAICTYAPFASICFGEGNGYDTLRSAKITACQDKDISSDLSCTGVTDNPNAIAWAGSFETALPTSPDTVNRKNQFLKGGATALSNVGLTDIISASLNLATATFGDNPLGGEASDGVAFFRGTHSGGAKHYYAGILNGTDLGGPLTQTTGSADWKGSFQYVNAFDNIPNAVDLTLRVNFSSSKAGAAGSISGQVPVPVFGMWAIAGTFNDKGIIEGKINWAFGEVGDMTGIIGQQGAVGAFYGATGPFTSNLSGGFVACPYDSVNNRCER